MKLVVVSNYEKLSQLAGEQILKQVLEKKDSVLGLATGSTPLGTYEYMIRKYQEGTVDFSQCITFNLDEYAGLPASHPQSYAYYMRQKLFDPIGLSPSRSYIPDGMQLDLERECDRYESLLEEKGPQDLQLLGLGRNGHIGFNEPSDHFEVQTHLVELAESTISANQRFFSSIDEVPKKACTMGIGTILKARKILLLVSGASKASILPQVLEGPVTPQVPASILQFHPDVTILADEEACRQLSPSTLEKMKSDPHGSKLLQSVLKEMEV